MKKRIISVDVNQGKKEYYIKKILTLIEKKEKAYVCFTNVHMLIEAYDDDCFAEVVNNATIAFADGFPIAKSFKLLYGIRQERISGMDFLPEFLGLCDEKKLSIAFLGSTEDVLDKANYKIKQEFSNIRVTALISPPFNEQWDNQHYIDAINKSNTDVVFIAFGCPKQEKWMYENFKLINSLLFGIGGALPTYVGEIKRAPKWMHKNGLEWFYRLLKEPKRMFKRYFYTNSKFILLCLKEWLFVKA